MSNLYPLKFKPILKSVVWGGEKIAPYKGIQTNLHNIGESWELSGVEGDESVVDNGALAGKTITELLKEFKEDLVGAKVYATTKNEFPLLIKFIDAKSDLSIQVHPNDELAAIRHNGSKGKTEMWYVVDTDKDAHLLTGFSKQITKEEYVDKVKENTITDVLCRYDVHPGDVFFLPAGRVHAICGGCFIAEIQQTSNITYRIYDYGRLGLDGLPRELHTELAKDAIDFSVIPDYKTHYVAKPNELNELVSCTYFTTSVVDIDEEEFTIDLMDKDSFMVIMCLEGEGKLTDYEQMEGRSCMCECNSVRLYNIDIKQGETILIPATSLGINITPYGKMKILTSTI